jgi:hypothetical protein
MCLLERPERLQLRPKASASSVVAVPKVATAPGPTSAPGGSVTVVSFPSTEVGPLSGSTSAFALPGISAPQRERSSAISTLVSATSIPSMSPRLAANVHEHGMRHLQASNQSPERRQLGTSFT